MKNFLCVAVATLAIVGCSKDRNNDPIANIKEAIKDKDLQDKSFVSDKCDNSVSSISVAADTVATALDNVTGGDVKVIKSQNVSYFFTGVNVTRTTRKYASTDCSGDALYNFLEKGTFDVDRDKKVNGRGHFMDLEFKTVNVKIATEDGAKAANALTGLCGKKDWKVGDDVPVTEHSADADCLKGQVPRKVANIYDVDGGKLTLGDSSTADIKPTARPASLESTVYLSK